MPPTREVHADGWSVHLDLAGQVLRLHVPEFQRDGQVFRLDGGSPPLLPVLPAAAEGPVSAATLLMKAKQFDDGLSAAVELAAQHGAGRFPAKAFLLRSLAATLAAGLSAATGAAMAIHAACKLGGMPVAVPDSLRARVHELAAKFLGDELASKPVGYYTWTPELTAIFHQDRFLQRLLDPTTADDLARAVERAPGAADALAACLRLNARLTNPPATSGGDAGRRAFLPASRSHEQVLVERLFGDRPVPDGFDLLGELVGRVRSGEISLGPTADSGWYDHQAWSLEPLVVPDGMAEASRLELDKGYRRHLEDLFRGALAMARETHAQRVVFPACGMMPSQQPIPVRPGLTVEPLPSLYARRAACYRFVRSVLEDAFGAEALAGLHRLTQEGPGRLSLADELVEIEKLFDGAASTARRELGMADGPGDEVDRQQFAAWRANLGADHDVSRDCRMMVPVYFDVQRRKTKVWAFLGWRTASVSVSYATEPMVIGMEREQPTKPQAVGPPPVEFVGDRYNLAEPVVAEVHVTQVLDRDEFRSHCDRHATREAILANLR